MSAIDAPTSRPRPRRPLGVPVLGAAVVGLGAASLVVGVSNVSLSALIEGDATARMVLVEARIPRTVSLVLGGSSMAIAGLLMMTLTGNRFVAPSTAGTIPSAGLGILVATLFLGESSVGARMGVAIVTSLLGTLALVALLRRLRSDDPILVPLVGIMFGGVVSAATAHLAFRHDLLQTLGAWQQGDASGVLRGRYEWLWLVAGLAVPAFVWADRLTAAGMGRDVAVGLGIGHDRLVIGGLAVASVVTAVNVVVLGAVPFLGLVVPNLCTRRWGDHLRHVAPITGLAGAAALLAADLIGRTVRAPYEIPVGTVAGVLGGAALVGLLLRTRGAMA